VFIFQRRVLIMIRAFFAFGIVVLIATACEIRGELSSVKPPDDPLLLALESPSRATRYRALNEAVASPGTPTRIRAVVNSFRYETVFMLHGRATHPTAQTRYLVAHATGAFPALVESLKSDNPNVRRHAALTLGLIGRVDALPPLRWAMKDEIDRLTAEAENDRESLQAGIRTMVYAMSMLSPRETADDLIAELVNSRSVARRAAVIDALSQLFDPLKVRVVCRLDVGMDVLTRGAPGG
jgi:HEAT repeat protein